MVAPYILTLKTALSVSSVCARTQIDRHLDVSPGGLSRFPVRRERSDVHRYNDNRRMTSRTRSRFRTWNILKAHRHSRVTDYFYSCAYSENVTYNDNCRYNRYNNNCRIEQSKKLRVRILTEVIIFCAIDYSQFLRCLLASRLSNYLSI